MHTKGVLDAPDASACNLRLVPSFQDPYRRASPQRARCGGYGGFVVYMPSLVQLLAYSAGNRSTVTGLISTFRAQRAHLETVCSASLETRHHVPSCMVQEVARASAVASSCGHLRRAMRRGLCSLVGTLILPVVTRSCWSHQAEQEARCLSERLDQWEGSIVALLHALSDMPI